MKEVGNLGDQSRESNQGKGRQMPDASQEDTSQIPQYILHKELGASSQESFLRASALGRVFAESAQKIRSYLSEVEPGAISYVDPEGLRNLAEIVIRQKDTTGAGFLRMLDKHNLPAGSLTNASTAIRLFPGVVLRDAAASEQLRGILHAEKQGVLDDRKNPPYLGLSVPYTAGLRSVVEQCSTHGLSPSDWIETYGVDTDHKVDLLLSYYSKATEEEKEDLTAANYREEITRAFLHEDELSDTYAHQKANMILAMQPDDAGRKRVFARFKQLDEALPPTRDSFNAFRFTADRILHSPEAVTQEDAEWIRDTADSYKQHALTDIFMEDIVMMEKYILPLHILLARRAGASAEQLISDMRQATSDEITGYPSPNRAFLLGFSVVDEASNLKDLASFVARQGDFAAAGAFVSAIDTVIVDDGSQERIINRIQLRQQALQECLQTAKTPEELAKLRQAEAFADLGLGALIDLKEAVLAGDSESAQAITHTLISSLTGEEKGDIGSFDTKAAIDYAIQAVYKQSPAVGNALASEMVHKLLEVDAKPWEVATSAAINATQGDLSVLKALYLNAERFEGDKSFVAYTEVALLAVKLLQEEQQS